MRSVAVERLWWINPAWLFSLVMGSTMALAIAQTEQNYALYNTPKYLHAYHGILAAGVIAVFGIGCQLALITGRIPTPLHENAVPWLRAWVYVASGLTIFGYAAWLAVGLKNGFSLGLVREMLVGDDPELSYTIANEIFANISGVTTCTQFATSAVPIGVWLYSRGERRILWPLAIVAAAGLARAFILSERIALIELVVPASIVAIRQYVLAKRLPVGIALGLNAAPLLGVVALLFFFGGAEYLRSWKYYQKDFDSIAEFTVWRMSGYYTTAHNNSAMALETKTTYELPYFTVQSLWAFPGVSKLPIGYKSLIGVDPNEQHLYMLERFGTPELNNGGGLLQPALDFGILGLFIYWFGCGYITGKLYRCYLVGSIAGIMLFPLFFLAILESPRFLYLANQRAFPALVAIACVIWFVSRCTNVFEPTQPESVSFAQSADCVT